MAITAMGLGTKAAPEGANLDPQREFWSWLRAFLHPNENGDNNAHQRAYFSGFGCRQTDPAGMSIKIGGTGEPDSAVLVVAPVGKPVLLSTDGTAQEVTIPTAPATGSRIDAVVSYIDTTSPVTDAETPGTPEYVHTIVVQGTAASNPSAPTNEQIVAALPAGAGGTYYRWCDVRVAASQTVITNSDIIDKKPAPPNVYLTDGSITTAKLANRAVTSDKIDRTTLTDLFFMPGETITEDMRGFGHVTSSAKDIFLAFPMGGKSLALINSVTINSGNMTIRCDNKYAVDNESIRNYATSLSVSPNLGVLTLHIGKSSGFGVTNNSAVAAQGTLSITFNG